MDILEHDFATLINRVSTRAQDERLPDVGIFKLIFRHPVRTVFEAMSREIGRIFADVKARLAKRTE